MASRKKKIKSALLEQYRAQLFIVLGFFGAALTTEVITIVHEWAKNIGAIGYWIYSISIVFVAWPLFMLMLGKLIDEIYLNK